MGDDDAVATWFQAATETVYEAFNSPKAGFNTAAHELYLDLSGPGMGAMFVGDAGRHGPRFRSVPLGECFVACDPWGRIDTLFRIYPMSARNLLDEWPEKCPRKVREVAAVTPDQPFEVIHAVYPREPDDDRRGEDDVDETASCYVLRDGNVDLERGTFRDFPYMVPRWQRRSGEDYGAGPGMAALPDVRLLNKLEELNLRGLAKVIDPVTYLPDDGFLTPVVTQPGGQVYFRAGSMTEGDRPFQLPTQARPDLGLEYIQHIEQRIAASFYVNWMNLPTRPNMTATEVLQRRDEQLRLLGPMVARLQSEFLGPLIERTFAILWRNGLLPEPPDELAGQDWHVEYLSPLALSQKASDADAVLRWVGAMGQVAMVTAQPGPVADQIDVGATGRFLADRYGAPQEVLASKEDAAAAADARAQAAQAAQAVEGVQGMARAAKDGAGAMQAMQGGEMAA
jgi:hypothetical protein